MPSVEEQNREEHIRGKDLSCLTSNRL